MDTIRTSYLSMYDRPGPPATDCIKTELHFCGTLEHLLGGSEGVARSYSAWCAAAEADGMDLSLEGRPLPSIEQAHSTEPGKTHAPRRVRERLFLGAP